MLVSSHKGEEDDPAPIPMSLDTEYLMNVFIDKLRPLVTENTSAKSKIFLKKTAPLFRKEPSAEECEPLWSSQESGLTKQSRPRIFASG